MLTWDHRWSAEREQLTELPSPSQFKFALACVDRVAGRLWPTFENSTVAGELSQLRRSMDLMWRLSGPKSSVDAVTSEVHAHISALEAMIPADDSPGITVPGWSDLLNATVLALLCWSGVDTARNSFDAAAFSYQSVLEWRILSKLERDMLEDEVAQLERQDLICMEELEYQVNLLHGIQRGQSVVRSLLT